MSDLRKEQYYILLSDCLNAFNKPLQLLKATLTQEKREIVEKLGKKQQKGMSTIEEEQETDREGESSQTQKDFSNLRYQCNKQIHQLIEVNRQIQYIVNVYKIQMKELAVELVFQNNKVQELTQQSKQKEEGRADRKKKSANTRTTYANQKKEEEEELKARRAPSPFPENSCQNCAVFTQKIQTLQQQHTNWKALSAKIDQCKKKIVHYELQLKEKNEQLNLTKNKLVQSQKRQKKEQEEEEKKRLKKDNTTLRGQKVLLNNQIAALKRQLSEKTGLSETQQNEIRRLKMEAQSLNNALNWQVSNLTQLRMSINKQQDDQLRLSGQRNEGMYRYVNILLKQLEDQQVILNRFNEQSKMIEERWTLHMEKIDKKNTKISQLQTILQDKNETIIKLKTGSKTVEKGGTSGYQADMVKVLNKRLAQKQQRIRFLQESLRGNNDN